MSGPHTRFDGALEWYVDGKLHREDGPAFIHPDGTREWYQRGMLHRIDGPAIEISINETPKRSWWLNDKSYQFETWQSMLDIPDEEKVMLKLKYG